MCQLHFSMYVCLRLILEITVSIYVKRKGCYPCNRKRVKGLTLCVCVCVCVGSYVRWSALVKWSISQSMIPYKCLVTSDTYGTICILIELIRLHVGGIMEAQRWGGGDVCHRDEKKESRQSYKFFVCAKTFWYHHHVFKCTGLTDNQIDEKKKGGG